MERYNFKKINGESSSYDFLPQQKINYHGLTSLRFERKSENYSIEDFFNPRYSTRIFEPNYQRVA